MEKYVFAITLLIILLFASSVRAQTLWHGTEYGMTLEQAEALVPNVVRPLKPKHRSDGSEELLRLEDVTLVDKHFSASFFFSDGKLIEVTLSLEDGHNFDSAMRVFDSLVESLRAKHGPEIIRHAMKGSFTNIANATWLSGQTNITLFATSVGQNDATLNINYQVRVSRKLINYNLPNHRINWGSQLRCVPLPAIAADLVPRRLNSALTTPSANRALSGLTQNLSRRDISQSPQNT